MTNSILDRFLYVESNQIPLLKIDYGTIKHNIINPLTGKPYKGIVLEGVFADLSQNINNNRRIYDIPQYLELLAEFRKKVHSPRGWYGELEHPQSYAVNFNNVSHKILDVWYEEETQLVKGYVLILNKGKGLIARDIIESGGCLAISARAAGEEIDQPDGTKLARVKLLVTYDLVYHPGFSEAILKFKELNESQKMIQDISTSKTGFSYIIPENSLKNINESFNNYMDCYKSQPKECFLEWFGKNINESKQRVDYQEKEDDEERMKDSEIPGEESVEKNLQNAAKQQLNESQTKEYQKNLKLNQREIFQGIFDKEDNSVFDDSSGFVTEGIDI